MAGQSPQSNGFYRCGFGDCPFSALQARDLKVHMLNVHDPRAVKFSCRHCGSEEPSADSLLQHFDLHLHNAASSYYCLESCEFSSRSIDDVIDHMMKAHTDKRVFQCWGCDDQFDPVQSFVAHIKDNSLLISRCPYCSALHTQETRMFQHMMTSHPNKARSGRTQKILLCQERKKYGYGKDGQMPVSSSTRPTSAASQSRQGHPPTSPGERPHGAGSPTQSRGDHTPMTSPTRTPGTKSSTPSRTNHQPTSPYTRFSGPSSTTPSKPDLMPTSSTSTRSTGFTSLTGGRQDSLLMSSPAPRPGVKSSTLSTVTSSAEALSPTGSLLPLRKPPVSAGSTSSSGSQDGSGPEEEAVRGKGKPGSTVTATSPGTSPGKTKAGKKAAAVSPAPLTPRKPSASKHAESQSCSGPSPKTPRAGTSGLRTYPATSATSSTVSVPSTSTATPSVAIPKGSKTKPKATRITKGETATTTTKSEVTPKLPQKSAAKKKPRQKTAEKRAAPLQATTTTKIPEKKLKQEEQVKPQSLGLRSVRENFVVNEEGDWTCKHCGETFSWGSCKAKELKNKQSDHMYYEHRKK